MTPHRLSEDVCLCIGWEIHLATMAASAYVAPNRRGHRQSRARRAQQRVVRRHLARRQRNHQHRRRQQCAGFGGVAHGPGLSADGGSRCVHRPPGHVAWLHRRRRLTDRNSGDGAERRRHRQGLSGRRRRADYRAQSIRRRHPHSGRAGQGGARAQRRRSARIFCRSRRTMPSAAPITATICS